MQAHIGGLDWQPEVVLASFHGLPKSYFEAGDPYYCHCHKTTRLLREKLGWGESQLRLTFQSRFGPKEWLQPYTEQTVIELAKQGIKKLAIVTPGFAADCIETLEEIDIGVREVFLENGGEAFTMIPCLNEAVEHIDMLATIVT